MRPARMASALRIQKIVVLQAFLDFQMFDGQVLRAVFGSFMPFGVNCGQGNKQ